MSSFLSPCVTFYPSIFLSSFQGKELSYSELDLRKPKRFATFSFGLGKRKKSSKDRISQSTFGLHSPGIEEQEEVTPFPQSSVPQIHVWQIKFS